MTNPILAAVDEAADVLRVEHQHALDALAAECERRLQVLTEIHKLAATLDPAASVEAAGEISPPTGEPGHLRARNGGDALDETPRLARSSGSPSSGSAAVPPDGHSPRPHGTTRQQVLDWINQQPGDVKVGDIPDGAGVSYHAARTATKQLVDQGLIGAKGATVSRRYYRLTTNGTTSPPPTEEPAADKPKPPPSASNGTVAIGQLQSIKRRITDLIARGGPLSSSQLEGAMKYVPADHITAAVTGLVEDQTLEKLKGGAYRIAPETE